MPAALELYIGDEEEPIDAIKLGEIFIPEDGLQNGEPIPITCANTGTTNLRKISLEIEGKGRQQVQLARDENGNPGVWAAPGEAIRPVEHTVYRGEKFYIWVRGVFSASDSEDRLPFKLIFNATSTG